MKKAENTLLILVVFACIWWFFLKKDDTYRPVYYPDKNNLANYIRGPEVTTLDEARDWVYERNRIRGDIDWDYEIGKNCKPSKYGDIEICEETLR